MHVLRLIHVPPFRQVGKQRAAKEEQFLNAMTGLTFVQCDTRSPRSGERIAISILPRPGGGGILLMLVWVINGGWGVGGFY